MNPDQIKEDFKALVINQPFWTTFKVTLGFHLANSLVTLFGLGALAGILFTFIAIVKYFYS